MNIGITGKDNEGTAIDTGLTRKVHKIKFGHRDLAIFPCVQ
jgi:hypothetical protein